MPLWRLLEYVRTTFPAEGQRQRDTDCDLFTVSLGTRDFDDGLVTDVTFDCFEAVLLVFLGGEAALSTTFGVFVDG